MDRVAAAIAGLTHRRQGGRPFRPDRCLSAWRRQPPAYHRDRRYRERGKPADGGRGETGRYACGRRRSAAADRRRIRLAWIWNSYRAKRVADPWALARAVRLVLAQRQQRPG